ncbi:MAG TPA: flotillin domain-containing protein [Myxococcales bacterium]|nr:flotillin domain-containing protein [Myxococcales bacterium]
MLYGIEVWQLAAGLVGAVALGFLAFMSAMARFLKRPSPSEAIIRIGRANTDVFIGRSTWIVPVLHRAATMSLSTIGLTIRRASHEALVTKDYISTNLSAEFYIRVEPAEDDVKKAARTIGIDEGHASAEAIRQKSQELLEPKLVGALRAVAAQNDFLALHMNREHFAQEVSKALREDLGRNGFTLESVTITELAQTPLAEMRADDIFGASGRETVTNTVVQKNIAVKRKVQEEAERTAEIAREQEINVATQNRIMREGKAKEEEAAVKAEIAQQEAIQSRDLQRQAAIALEKARKEKTEQTAEIDKQKAVEAAQVDKQRTIEAAKVDKEITLTLKAKESAEADANRAAAQALKAQAEQQVITVGQVAEAERDKQVAIVAAQKAAEQERIRAEVEAYKKKVEAEVSAQSIKIRAQADADAAEKQAQSITRLAEAHREAGLKEAEVQREKLAAANSKSRELFLQETALRLLEVAPSLVRELVKPAERIGEIKVLQLGGVGNGGGTQPHLPLLGNALGPMMQTILQSSVMMPAMKELMKFVDMNAVAGAVSQAVQAVDPAKVGAASPAPVKAPARIATERPNDAH